MVTISNPPDSVFSLRPRALWVGMDAAADLGLARAAVMRLAEVHVTASPASAIASPPEPFRERSPAVILLATTSPGRWALADAVALSIRWPLAPVVSVAATIVDGRRRSGPPLSGVEEVMWHDIPGRFAAWVDDRKAGRPGTLGLPTTARREEGIFESVRSRADGLRVSVAAMRSGDLECLADLATAAGANVASRSRGRPPLDDDAAVLAWDVGLLDAPALAWLRMLVANRPGRFVILFESFPRAESTEAAMEAGAVAVLGRPCGVESFAGTLLSLGSAGRAGL